jgi:hypothetical protein
VVIFFLLGCSMGPSLETLIDELRIVAQVADLPEATAGEVVTLTALTADPLDEGYDVLSWTCTFTGESCAESASGGAWGGLTLTEQPTEPVVTSYAVPEAFSSFLTDEPVPLVQVWTLSCLPGLCPPIEAAREADPDTEQLQEWLTDPTSFLVDVPMEGVSLGLRSILLSTRPEGERGQNPGISCVPDEGELVADVETELAFTCSLTEGLTETASVWGYTTAGGWQGASLALLGGESEVEYSWFAPEEPGEATVWVVVVDGQGGVGLWEETLTAR